jgi:hypothetical protein
MIHTMTTAPGWSSWTVVVLHSNTRGTGDPWPGGTRFYDSPWAYSRPTVVISHPFRNRRVAEHLHSRRWPCALAVPPSPPPVPLRLASEERSADPEPSDATPRPQRRPLLRLSARQRVPPRSRPGSLAKRLSQPSSPSQEKVPGS